MTTETISALQSELATLRARLSECNAECICGCPESEHESLGEDGEQCDHEDHECIRSSPSVVGIIKDLRAKLAAAEERARVAERERDEAMAHADTCADSLAMSEMATLKLQEERDRETEQLREVLRKVDEEQNGIAYCSWCAMPTSSDHESKTNHQRECNKSPIVAERDEARRELAAKDAEIERLRAVNANHNCEALLLKRTPAGTRLAYLTTSGDVIVTGIPPQDEDEESHSCDAMGCGWDHVIERHRISPAAQSTAREDGK